MDADKDTPADASLAQRRGRREKVDKGGKMSALQKLKMARETGCKNQPQADESNVYDEVDETEYSRIVQDRQNDDWIVDDGTGYVEDGREIFDDDLYADETKPSKAKKPKHSTSKSNFKPQSATLNSNNHNKSNNKSNNIKALFAAVSNSHKGSKSKNKMNEKSGNLDGDDLLDSLVQELGGADDDVGDNDDDDVVLPTPMRVKKTAMMKKKRRREDDDDDHLKKGGGNSNSHSISSNKTQLSSGKSDNSYSVSKGSGGGGNSSSNGGVTRSNSNGGGSGGGGGGKGTGIQDVAKGRNLNIHDVREIKIGNGESKHDDDDDDDVDDDSHKDITKSTINYEDSIKNGNNNKNNNGNDDDDDDDDDHMVSNDVDFDDDDDDEVMNASVLDMLPTIEEGDDNDVDLEGGGGNDVDADDSDAFKFYWLDAYEDHFKQPGTVFLFGKTWKEDVKKHVSCCVVVRNVWRKVYLLPRTKRVVEGREAEVTFLDVYNEFSKVAQQFNIQKFKSKKATKLYAFERAGVPMQSEYLEVHYPADQPRLPADLQGETFSCIFGSTTTSLESLLIGRALKGPSWLAIRNHVVNSPPISWCSVEISIDNMKDLQVMPKQPPPPSLVVMAISLITYNNPLDHKNELLGLCLLVNKKFSFDKKNNKNSFQEHFSAICRLHNCVFPFDLKQKLNEKMKGMQVEMVANEKGLLNLLIGRIHKIDPDVIMGHDVTSFDLDLLLHRLYIHKIPNWSRIGRLNRKQQAYKVGDASGRSLMGSCAGRLVCDIKTSAMELVRCRSYDLDELVSQLLKKKRPDRIEVVNVAELFSSSKTLAQLIHNCISDTTLISQISTELSILPLALQITTICGSLMSRTLVGGRSERNEYLLLHAFDEKNFIVPDKIFSKRGQEVEKKKADYAGGLVLEPKKGFYDQFILLLDFNSLYPSIIQEFNICFTTVDFANQPPDDDSEQNKNNNKDGDNNNNNNNNKNNINSETQKPTTTAKSSKHSTTDPLNAPLDYDESWLPESGLPAGILPTEIRKLVESRRNVRALMKGVSTTSDLYAQYDIRQKALKLTANSMYGCLGFGKSRFYARKLAALITGKGREILMRTKDLVESMNIEVIYGDTDSLMINTRLSNYNEAISLGNKIKSEVNKLYRLLEIDIDGVYQSLLLLKKKKYAGCMVSRRGDGSLVVQREMKGLDIVRRDWCPLAKQIGSGVLDDLFSGEGREVVVERIHERLYGVAAKAREGTLDKSLYTITKQLARAPEDYKEKEGLPHVQVALRLNKAGGRKLKSGDVVYYVVCQNGTTDPPMKRAYHPDELKKDVSLSIDINYYLSGQVLPVVSRLVDCIDGTDTYRVADCLGLDSKSYKPAAIHTGAADAGWGGGVEERFIDSERFTYACVSCATLNEIDSPYVLLDGRLHASLSRCANPSCPSPTINHHPYTLKNLLIIQLRKHLKTYHEAWMMCDDVACAYRTRQLPLSTTHRHPLCPGCVRGALKLEYPDSGLYKQLSYLSYLFDLDHTTFKGKAMAVLSEEKRVVIAEMKKLVDDKIQSSSYAHVDLHKVFACLMKGV